MESTRLRNKTLIIVEGENEEVNFFTKLFTCFPELSVKKDRIWVYGTTVYQLCKDIASEYGDDWAENGDDIDLPFVISKKKGLNPLSYKSDFTNILLVFDYERHYQDFNEDTVIKMQKVFNEPTDMGKLYLNYPMVEACHHLKALPDPDYNSRMIPTSMQPGYKYKNLVKQESCISYEERLYDKIDHVLQKKYGITDETSRSDCINSLLKLTGPVELSAIEQIAVKYVSVEAHKDLPYHIRSLLSKSKHTQKHMEYYDYMRYVFKEILSHNIQKSYIILNSKADNKTLKEQYEMIDLVAILNKQNALSRSPSGNIWVLFTTILFIADYNTSLLN